MRRPCLVAIASTALLASVTLPARAQPDGQAGTGATPAEAVPSRDAGEASAADPGDERETPGAGEAERGGEAGRSDEPGSAGTGGAGTGHDADAEGGDAGASATPAAEAASAGAATDGLAGARRRRSTGEAGGGDATADAAPPRGERSAPSRKARSRSGAGTSSRSGASATPEDRQPTSEPFDGVLGSHQSFWQIELGVQQRFIPTSGYDLFDEDDAFTQVAFGLGRTVFSRGPLSLAGRITGDWGQSEADARGQPTSLTALRLELGPELRYHFWHRAYAYGRVGIGTGYVDASLEDASTNAELESSGWAVSLSAVAGAAVEVVGTGSGHSRRPRLWLFAEAGYGFISASELRLEPGAEAGAPQRVAAVDLGSLALSGAQVRAGAAVTF